MSYLKLSAMTLAFNLGMFNAVNAAEPSQPLYEMVITNSFGEQENVPDPELTRITDMGEAVWRYDFAINVGEDVVLRMLLEVTEPTDGDENGFVGVRYINNSFQYRDSTIGNLNINDEFAFESGSQFRQVIDRTFFIQLIPLEDGTETTLPRVERGDQTYIIVTSLQGTGDFVIEPIAGERLQEFTTARGVTTGDFRTRLIIELRPARSQGSTENAASGASGRSTEGSAQCAKTLGGSQNAAPLTGGNTAGRLPLIK